MAQSVVRNAEGKWVIPATRRPDGTMRKERLVREGHIPQDEIAAYVPAAAKASRSRIPGLPVGAPTPVEPIALEKKPRRRAKPSTSETIDGNEEQTIFSAMRSMKVSTDSNGVSATNDSAPNETAADLGKLIKKLGKKIREIDEIAKKSSDPSAPPLTPEQQEKLSKRDLIIAEIEKLKEENSK